MREYARFLKEIIVFLAKIGFNETAEKDALKIKKKFKMTYKGELVEFEYNEFAVKVVEVSLVGSGS